MPFRRILVPFVETRSGKCAFEAAAVFARRLNSHVDVMHIRQRQAILPSTEYPISVARIEENKEKLNAAVTQLATGLKRLFDDLRVVQKLELVDSLNLPFNHTQPTVSWTDRDGYMPGDFAARARVCDLIFAAKPDSDAPGWELSLAEEIVFQSGRPVIVTDDYEIKKFPETIVAAWNGGREAARALGASMPLLKRGKKVVVISVGEIAPPVESAESAAAYLKLYGIRATHKNISAKSHERDEVLFLKHAKSARADLIVMGAYSHSRL